MACEKAFVPASLCPVSPGLTSIFPRPLFVLQPTCHNRGVVPLPGATMVMETRITKLLGIKHPIILPGMSWISTPELVAAVSNAGGLGILATGPLTCTTN